MSRRTLEGALYVAVAALVVWLGYSNWRLRGMVDDLRLALHSGPGRAVAPLAAGQQLAPIDAEDRSGRVVRISTASTLIVVDPACGSCAAVIDELRASKPHDVAVLAFHAPGVKALPEGVPADVPLYTLSRDRNPALALRLGGVPRVIRIAPGGRIRAVCKTLGECAVAG